MGSRRARNSAATTDAPCHHPRRPALPSASRAVASNSLVALVAAARKAVVAATHLLLRVRRHKYALRDTCARWITVRYPTHDDLMLVECLSHGCRWLSRRACCTFVH